MNFLMTHVSRDRNSCADRLTNLAVENMVDFVW